MLLDEYHPKLTDLCIYLYTVETVDSVCIFNPELAVLKETKGIV